MRLIDANELKKNYTASFVNAFGMEEAEMFVGVINQMPTAYDIDKVVEQLEIEKNVVKSLITPRGGKHFYEGTLRGLNKALKIVRGEVK